MSLLITDCTFPPSYKSNKRNYDRWNILWQRHDQAKLFYYLYCRYQTLRKPIEPKSSGFPPLSHLLLHFILRTALWCHQSLMLGHLARKWVRFTWLAIRWKGAWPHHQGQPLISQILIDSQLPPPLGFDISDNTSGWEPMGHLAVRGGSMISVACFLYCFWMYAVLSELWEERGFILQTENVYPSSPPHLTLTKRIIAGSVNHVGCSCV